MLNGVPLEIFFFAFFQLRYHNTLDEGHPRANYPDILFRKIIPGFDVFNGINRSFIVKVLKFGFQDSILYRSQRLPCSFTFLPPAA